MSGYYDRQGNPLNQVGMIAAFADREGRRVALTGVADGVEVSTVHLVLDHSYPGRGRPLIFETMVFGGDHDQHCWRYATEAEAQAGHEAVVAWLRGEADEPAVTA